MSDGGSGGGGGGDATTWRAFDIDPRAAKELEQTSVSLDLFVDDAHPKTPRREVVTTLY